VFIHRLCSESSFLVPSSFFPVLVACVLSGRLNPIEEKQGEKNQRDASRIGKQSLKQEGGEVEVEGLSAAWTGRGRRWVVELMRSPLQQATVPRPALRACPEV